MIITNFLVFCTRNIDEVMIPEFIQVIGSYAFDNCHRLKRIDIFKDSILKIFEKGSINHSMIESISITDHVTHYCI